MTEHEQLSILSTEELADLETEIEQATHHPVAKDLATEMREFHGWTIDKLEILRLYLRGGYVRVAGGGSYIDAFAGQGQGAFNGTTFSGSAIVAAQSEAFGRLHLIEQDQRSHRLLAQRLAELPDKLRARCELHPPGDCNQIIPTLLDAAVINSDKPCFAFLDPDSTQLAWETIEAIAAYKTYTPNPVEPKKPKACKIELWILFNTHQAIYRLWADNREKYPETMGADALDHLMGGREAWWDLWESGQPSNALLRRYVERLKSLGYQYVLPQPVRDPVDGRVHYYMIHVTDHPSALGLMRWAKKQTGRIYATELPGTETF